MCASGSSVVMDSAGIEVVQSVVPKKPAKESDREAWRHNELSPPSQMVSTRRRISNKQVSFGCGPEGERSCR